jgi:hypothetical protein
MNYTEWMLGEAAVRHVAEFLNVQPEGGVGRGVARSELLIAAAAGRIAVVDREGSPIPIDPSTADAHGVSGFLPAAPNLWRVERVFFKRADVKREWKLPKAKAQAAKPEAPPKGPAGAAELYDWEAVITELVRLADVEGLGKSKLAVFRHLAKWYADRTGGEGPQWQTVKRQIDHYLVHMGEKRRAQTDRPPPHHRDKK